MLHDSILCEAILRTSADRKWLITPYVESSFLHKIQKKCQKGLTLNFFEEEPTPKFTVLQQQNSQSAQAILRSSGHLPVSRYHAFLFMK